MNIKQAEELSGVSRRNIRFYEQEGLITPTRNPENDYREYTDEDVQILKRIRILRMVDMPLEQIRDVLQGKTDLKSAADAQKEILRERTKELETAIRFCGEFAALAHVDSLDADSVLRKMEAPENQQTLFHSWIDDFKSYYQYVNKKTMTFVPDGIISSPEDLTMELFRYGDQNEWDMVITKEGWKPELVINGYEYTAEVLLTRYYWAPITLVRCHAVHPEEFEPEDVSTERKRILRIGGKIIPYLLLILLLSPALGEWFGWAMLLLFSAVIFLFQWQGGFLIHYRINGK